MLAVIRLNGDPNPTTPNFVEDYQWVHNYLSVHQLSVSSYRYAYIFWALVALAASAGGLARILGGEKTTLGAIWTQWSIRRPTWRRKYERLATGPPKASSEQQLRKSLPRLQYNKPTNSQMLFLVVLIIVTAALCTLGPDYIPSGGTSPSPVRDVTPRNIDPFVLEKRSNQTVTAQSPSYIVSKAWWTAGGRTGLMAFALIPLCVLIALKAPPFALFALRFPLQLHSDKLAWAHRWLGRIIYICTVAHVATWSVQLARDHRAEAGPAWKFMFIYPKFIYAIAAFVSMNLLVVLSSSRFRDKGFEYFYFLHLLLVSSTLVFSALHYPPLGWFLERLWRFLRVLWINGRVLPPSKRSVYSKSVTTGAPSQAASSSVSSTWMAFEDRSSYEMDVRIHSPSPSLSTLGGFGKYYDARSTVQPPPPGYARAELLPGRTIRLTISTPRRMTWAPGQYALLNIPCISRLTSHPFTIASVSEDVKGSSTPGDDESKLDSPHELVFFIRAKQGRSAPLPSLHAPMFRAHVDGPYGSAVRARWLTYPTILIITGGTGVSFGLPILEYLCLCLSDRSREYFPGRGPSFAHSDTRTTRVRFVWLIREYSHLTWCATALRRCMAMVRPGVVQVDIFVTNFAPNVPPWQIPSPHSSPPTPHFAAHARDRSRSLSPDSLDSDSENSVVDLAYASRGKPQTQRRGRRRPRLRSDDVEDTDMNEEVDPSAKGRADDGAVQHTVYSDSEEEETHDIAELTNFEGEEDARAPGEIQFSMTLKRKGRHIRMKSYHRDRDRARRSPVQSPGRSTHRTAKEDRDSQGSITASVVFGSSFPYSPSPVPSSSPRSDLQSLPLPHPPPPSASPKDWPGLHHPLHPRPHITNIIHTPATNIRHRDCRQPTLSADDPFDIANRTTIPLHGTNRSFDTRSFIDERTRLRVISPTPSLVDIGDPELDDLAYVASLARSGRPKLDRILAEEVNRASGALAVACCGPTSLSNVVRKVVSTQINPSHVYNGDERGAIAFISEDFSL
ncbi:hypothetical protein BS47DRAFT_1341050 [Hydnum rufescens UP504]|uniref:ferric-chelate reductase (NADPH) n=1 Tax=Hydnum rufescens UP504 TaxID=1448309 RepID=A0A9P6B4X7_9AGAM|nr:hypothetical protein BS47DRAFT_1341050 [Hydnum rufescens UP504]